MLGACSCHNVTHDVEKAGLRIVGHSDLVRVRCFVVTSGSRLGLELELGFRVRVRVTVGSNGKYMFDEIYVFLIFPDICFVEFWVKQKQTFDNISRVWRLRKTLIHDDGALDIYIYYIVQLSRLEGSKHMLTDATGHSKVIFDVPKCISKMPQPPLIYKRGAANIYIFWVV